MTGIDPSDLDLRTEKISALPIVNRYLERLGIGKMFLDRMESGGSIPVQTSLLVLLRNIILEREPVYGIGRWVTLYSESMLGLSTDQVPHMNDDRIGRSLDQLYDSDRGSMLTDIVVRSIHGFGIAMDEFHNDSTTITFSGDYDSADGSVKREKESLNITYGHNKDHRPDLKQLLWSMTVSADCSVPVHYSALDGNTADNETHIQTWESIRSLAGRSDFLYVADSKLCTRENMQYISDHGGRFITVLPGTRAESSWFREYVQDHTVQWADAFTRKRTGGDIEFRVFDSPIPSSEGYRIVWVWSSQKEDLDAGIRERSVRNAITALEKLESDLRKRHMKRDRIIRRAEEAVTGIPYVAYQIMETTGESFRQSGRGRPSSKTEYRRITSTEYHIKWNIRADLMEKASRSDGTFPLITNCTDGAADILMKYKYQPMLEKRYEELKSVYGVMPVLFKNVERIEAFLFLYFIAMLVHSLIERDVRMEMKRLDMKSLPVYSEDRDCTSPTSGRIISQFSDIQIQRLFENGKEIRVFRTGLNDTQRTILSLLHIPEDEFTPR